MVSDTTLKEAEEIGKGLESQKPTISPDAPDIFFLHKLMETQPDLVPRKPYDYYKMFEKSLQKKEGYTTQKLIAKSEGLGSSGSLYAPFKRIREAIADLRGGKSQAPVKELPSMDTARLIEIYKKGKLVQLDPRALLPPKGHKHYELSRYFQKRRGPRQHTLEVLAESIGKIGMYEPPTIQDTGSHNGFIQRPDDGFSRLHSWIMADEKAGGTDKKPVLEYPVCLLVDCTNAEGELIALEKNKNKDNYDIGDRDYAIVTMHERHPEIYTQKKLCEFNNLSPSTVSNLIGAWQRSWPCDEKKGETPDNNPIRKALEERQITTYHARQLLRLEDYPKEQKRKAEWLLEEIGKYGQAKRDSYISVGSDHDEVRGRFVTLNMDPEGISAGHLKQRVGEFLAKTKQAEKITRELKAAVKDGSQKDSITETEFALLIPKLAQSHKWNSYERLPVKYVGPAIRAAGIKIAKPKKNAEELKPASPATSEGNDVRSETSVLTTETVQSEPEPEPVKVCENCQLALKPTTRNEEYTCQIELEPTEGNECPVQSIAPGRPQDIRYQCVHCGGYTIPLFLEQCEIDIETEEEITKAGTHYMAHTLCLHDIKIKELDIKGQCHSCCRNECELLDAVEDGGLDVEVKFCPSEKWFYPRPEKSLKDINKEVKKRIENFVKQAREDFEKSKTATVVAAGRSL